MKPTVTLSDITAAARRIEGDVLRSPCPESISLGEITGARVSCKLDNLQRTGSFKERGARNALTRLSPAQRRVGVIAASAGNHALGLAYHGKLLGIPVTVVMPNHAPLIKVATCERMGARVVMGGQDFSEVRALADTLAIEQGLSYINGYDDPAIIAG
ncbi:MAG TPA: pyridoxal-phosphate dependent enzyme, partial [Opitutus sp.]|nr:pyridoxal-phosphate dependent enzyme [Opitutus sp.]